MDRNRWGLFPWVMLLGALLFGCGYLFGTVRAGEVKAADDEATVTTAAEPFVSPVAPPVSGDAPQAPDDGWALTLVNRDNPVPEGYSIPELVELRNGQSIDRRAYPALQRMMNDCRAAGLDPLICSSYRSYEFQSELFEDKVKRCVAEGYDRAEAETLAEQWVARPGTSEHELGLAVDIVDNGYQNLDEGQEDTAVGQWMLAHCQEYGFILRYPTDKSALTGIQYEPWHYRYVGGAAADIMARGLCLEEFLAQ